MFASTMHQDRDALSDVHSFSNNSALQFRESGKKLLQLRESKNRAQSCQAKMDVMFVLDTTGSLGQGGWDNVVQFTKDAVNALEMGPNFARVGVAMFDKNAYVPCVLEDDKTALLNCIDNRVFWQRPGGTCMHAGMRAAYDQLMEPQVTQTYLTTPRCGPNKGSSPHCEPQATPSTARSLSGRVIILLSDGRPSACAQDFALAGYTGASGARVHHHDVERAQHIRDQFKDQKGQVFTVAATTDSTVEANIKAIATESATNDYFFQVDDTTELIAKVQNIVTKVCESVVPPPTVPPPTMRGDPHCQNLQGKSFDIYSPGQVTLIRYPMKAFDAAASLLVRADIQKLGKSCHSIYITNVNFTGSWLQRDVNLRVKPWDVNSQGKPSSGHKSRALERESHHDHLIEILEDGRWSLINDTHTQDKSFPKMKIDRARKVPQVTVNIQGVEIVVWAQEKKRQSLNFLNLQLQHFKELPHQVGGVLGVEDYVPPEGAECSPEDISLIKSTEEEIFLSTAIATY
jgi:hypothetical protein